MGEGKDTWNISKHLPRFLLGPVLHAEAWDGGGGGDGPTLC